MFDEPKPLPANAVIDGFTPDATNGWIAAYVGPCGDAGCGLQHARIYLIPMIGWLTVGLPIDGGDTPESCELRPAVMTPSGIVTDYLDVPSDYKLIAVLRVTNDVVSVARAIYHHKYGDDALPLEVEAATLPN